MLNGVRHGRQYAAPRMCRFTISRLSQVIVTANNILHIHGLEPRGPFGKTGEPRHYAACASLGCSRHFNGVESYPAINNPRVDSDKLNVSIEDDCDANVEDAL